MDLPDIFLQASVCFSGDFNSLLNLHAIAACEVTCSGTSHRFQLSDLNSNSIH